MKKMNSSKIEMINQKDSHDTIRIRVQYENLENSIFFGIKIRLLTTSNFELN